MNHSNSSSTTPRREIGDFSTDARVLFLSILALVVGAAGTVVAKGLVWLIGMITNAIFFQSYATTLPSLANHTLGIWVVLVPAIGGLVIGLMARYGSERIRGHGIPEALEAILIGRSKMSLKVALLKPLSSAISIGTGGPFGAEGPIIMTGGAFGSLFAQFFNLSSIERRTLLVAGAAAGMCAIFNTPIAAALLAVELLLFEWKPRSFIPVCCAVATAASLRIYMFGSSAPLFALTMHEVISPSGYLIAAAMGVIAGLGAGLLTTLVYAFEDLFPKLPVHWMWWPCLGGLAVGLGGYFEPRALGVGYAALADLLHGNMSQAQLWSLLIVKALIWSIALGSGTSGGVLAPLLIIGAALGSIEANLLHLPHAEIWPLVSMAAVMGGTMRSPLTASIFAFELTDADGVLPALFLASVVAYGVTVLLLKRSILTEKVARRGHHLVREYAVDPYDLIRVGEAMNKEVVSLPATMSVRELSESLAHGDKRYLTSHAFPLVHGDGTLAGILTRADVVVALDTDPSGTTSLLEAGSSSPRVAYPDQLVSEAVRTMVIEDIGRLPVVSRENPKQLVGYLGRAQLIACRLRHIKEEHEREAGWGPSGTATQEAL